MKRLKQAIRALCAAGQPFALVSIREGTGSMPRHQGASMLVREDGSIEGSVGGGVLEAKAIERAQMAIRERRGGEMPFDLSSADAAESDMICGGKGVLSVRFYDGTAEPQDELREIDDGRMVIFGGGHIARQLSRLAGLLEIPVTVVEDREEYCSPERFPEDERMVVPDYGHIPPMQLGARDMVVIVTRGHLGDREALLWALGTQAGYIGMIGSKRKRDLMYEKMVADGLDPKQLSRVHSPIGLPIGAQTPEEIAVSIAAEIVAFRNAEA
ncbi:XdhC family protein [Agathobaculum sp.]|uniref:XdhC family protein n=1 Tax=Agathobaculum sp. TaxID=2048138 RepID=UPI002A8403D7|nr:XdhC/CoxI family protein [Agathobaculum sp.]MDY3619516.1 XdhC/CoxI family protein [Agathobaculum sp.]